MKSLVFSAAVLLVLMTSCAPGTDIQVNTPDSTVRLTAPGPNPLQNEPGDNDRIAGLALGLWHGIIAPVTLVGSFFNPNMQIYEVHNNGTEYNLGFLVGVAIVFLLLGLFGGRWR